MKYSPSAFVALLLAAGPLLARAIPTSLPLETRQGLEYPKCVTTGEGWCTIYMATSDGDDAGYRTAALFDHNCVLQQALYTDRSNPKITLRGRLPHYVDLHVDDFYRPRGFISYLDSDTPLGDTMACYKYPGTDGVGCRKAFDCSQI